MTRWRDVFGGLAASYDRWYESDLGAYCERVEMNALREVLGEGYGATALEVGAGTGRVAAMLASWGWSVTAVEPSLPMLRLGRLRANRSVWIAALGEALPFRAATFDAAVAFTVLEFSGEPGAVLSEMFRAVRPGGRVVVGFLAAGSAWSARYEALAARGEAPWNRTHLLTVEEVEALVGRPAVRRASAVHLPPDAKQPYDTVDRTARRDGSVPAVEVLSWTKEG